MQYIKTRPEYPMNIFQVSEVKSLQQPPRDIVCSTRRFSASRYRIYGGLCVSISMLCAVRKAGWQNKDVLQPRRLASAINWGIAIMEFEIARPI
jgi:hypothetical protein